MGQLTAQFAKLQTILKVKPPEDIDPLDCFQEVMSEFYDEFNPKLAQLEKTRVSHMEMAERLAKYYGEAPDTPWNELLEKFHEFGVSCAASEDTILEIKLNEEKKLKRAQAEAERKARQKHHANNNAAEGEGGEAGVVKKKRRSRRSQPKGGPAAIAEENPDSGPAFGSGLKKTLKPAGGTAADDDGDNPTKDKKSGFGSLLKKGRKKRRGMKVKTDSESDPANGGEAGKKVKKSLLTKISNKVKKTFTKDKNTASAAPAKKMCYGCRQTVNVSKFCTICGSDMVNIFTLSFSLSFFFSLF